jgi:hypothetical protein
MLEGNDYVTKVNGIGCQSLVAALSSKFRRADNLDNIRRFSAHPVIRALVDLVKHKDEIISPVRLTFLEAAEQGGGTVRTMII